MYQVFYCELIALIKKLGGSLSFYSVSAYSFMACLAIAFLSFIVCCCSKRARTRGFGFLLKLFTFFLFFNVFLCSADVVCNQGNFSDFYGIYIYCFVQFAMLCVLYAAICAQRALLGYEKEGLGDKKSKCFVPLAYEIRTGQKRAETPREEQKKLPEPKRLEEVKSIEIFDKMGYGKHLADINVAYVRSVIDRLKTKNISEDERARLDDIDMSLRQSLPESNLAAAMYNDNFLWLVKQMTKYDVVI